MLRIKNPEIIAVTWNTRSIMIEWRDEAAGIAAASCLYQHSDGTWAVDPWSRSLGSTFGKRLLDALTKEFVRKAFIYDDASSFSDSEVARVEGLLKGEELYRNFQASKRDSSKKKKPKNQPIRVWFADKPA